MYLEVGLAYSEAQYTWEIFMVSLTTTGIHELLIMTSCSDMHHTCPRSYGVAYFWHRRLTSYHQDRLR